MLCEWINPHDCSSPLILLLAKQASCLESSEFTVEMKRCAAYEITTLAKKKVVMEVNPAYEHVKMNIPQ